MPTDTYNPALDLVGTVPTNYDLTYGGTPVVPNPAATSQAAILANLGNMPNLMSIVRGANPNYDTQLGIIGDQLAGRVPTDVTNQLAQLAAERGVAIGSPGSPNALANYLNRFLGTSYAMQQAGMNANNALTGQTWGMINPYMLTPEQMQSAQTAANIYASAPNPRLAAEQALKDYLAALNINKNAIGPTPVLPSDVTGLGQTSKITEQTGPLLGNQGGVIVGQNPAAGSSVPTQAPYTGGYRWNPTTGTMERTGPTTTIPSNYPSSFYGASTSPVDTYAKSSARRDPYAGLLGAGSSLYPSFNLGMALTEPTIGGPIYDLSAYDTSWADPNNLWSDFWGYTPGEESTYGAAEPYTDQSWMNFMGFTESDPFGLNNYPTDYVSSPNVGDYYDWSMATLPDTSSTSSFWGDPFAYDWGTPTDYVSSPNVSDYYDWSMTELPDTSWADPNDLWTEYWGW